MMDFVGLLFMVMVVDDDEVFSVFACGIMALHDMAWNHSDRAR